MSVRPETPTTTSAHRPQPAPPPRGRLDADSQRLALASLEAEAEEFGRPQLAAALRRLALMHDVAECLASSLPEAAGDVTQFNAQAYERLTNVTDDDEHEQGVAWVLSESSARWGEYLALVDPTFAPGEPAIPGPPDPEPPLDDGPAAIDASTLFRLLTGNTQPTTQSSDDWPAALDLLNHRPAMEPEPPAPGTHSHGGAVPEIPAPVASPARSLIPPPPQSVSIDPELRDVFLAEATDLFERIQGSVLTLQPGPGQGATLHEIGRCLHTLKGAAGSVDLTQVAAVVHNTEEQIESAEGTLTVDRIDALHALLTYLDGVFAAVQGRPVPRPEPPLPTPAPAPAQVQAPARAAAPASAPPVAPPASRPAPQAVPIVPAPEPVVTVSRDLPAPAPVMSPAPAAAPRDGGSTEGPVRVGAERIDELMDIASELISRRGLWAAQAEAMKELAAMARTCRTRVTATVDRLRDLAPLAFAPGPGRTSFDGQAEVAETICRLAEQVDDLVVLIDSAQGAAKPLSDNSDVLARQTLLLWEALQAIRIVPVRGLFQRLMRVAHDAARVEGRQVEVVTRGDETGLDRAVQDKAFEPLLHVVRNAVCHGIEPPEERIRAGKPATGRITLEAARSGNTLVLSVLDDGRGLDCQAIAAKARRLGLIGPDDRPSDDRLSALIFQPGFSTRDAANAVAGRGVGMDVVSQEVSRLHGTVSLASQPGHGVRLSIGLPARLALEQAMVLRVDGQAFALPVELIELAQPLEAGDLVPGGATRRIRIRDEVVPLVVVREALGCPQGTGIASLKVLLVRTDGEPLALAVDAIEGTRELVIRPLGPLLAGHPLVSGTSLSATGEVVFSLNIAGLAWWFREGVSAGAPGELLGAPQTSPLLVVDDSISVRRAVARQLRLMGLDVEEASDGLEALGKIRSTHYGLVVSDLEMPRMDGFELLAELGRLAILPGLPVLVASTRADAETRRRVISLGARAFLAKPLDQDDLAAHVQALLNAPAVTAGT